MSRPSVFSFYNYRLWLRRLLQYYVDDKGYDFARFASLIQVDSDYLGRLLERAVDLDEPSKRGIEGSLGLSPTESDYLQVMILFSHAKSPDEEEKYYHELIRLRRIKEIEAAHNAVLHIDPHWRDVSSLTLSVNREQFLFLKTMLSDLRRSVLHYLADTEEVIFGEADKNAKQNAYQLNLQLFQLTQGEWPVAEQKHRP